MKALELSCALKASRENLILNHPEYVRQAIREFSWQCCLAYL